MVEYEHKLLCNVCGSTSAPEGSRFCPDCGNNLAVSNNTDNTTNPPMAAAIPVVIDEEEERVNIAVMNSATPVVGTSPPHQSTNTTGIMSAMYFKNPSSEMVRLTSSNSAYGGVLFIQMSCPNRRKFTVPKNVHVGQVLNGQTLDLSYADFVHPITTISVGTVLGGCKVIVPRGVRVETKGLGILGGFKGLSSTAIHAGQDAPTVVVQGVSILAGVKVVKS